LGVKLDCVPGRSTHHTFYVDSIGFYFGQCAEICGRFHHHMPIKICALPFEHFLVWWNTFGISKVTMLDFNSKKKKMYTQYKYT
jgi:cytochrome c oxidase subunit 2